jgi:hypothetical protein
MGKLTAQVSTPSILQSSFSSLEEHDAHVMPVTLIVSFFNMYGLILGGTPQGAVFCGPFVLGAASPNILYGHNTAS